MFLKRKFSFNIIKEKPVMVINSENHNINFIKNIFDKNSYNVYLGFYEINFFIFLKVILFKGIKEIKHNYFKYYVLQSNPKLSISFFDVNPDIYKIKKINNKIKSLIVQTGDRTNSTFSKLLKFKNKIDYACTFGKKYSSIYKENFSCKTFEIGSVRNNSYKIKKIINNKILCLSSFKEHALEISPSEKLILIYLKDFCKKKNLELNVLSRYGNNLNIIKIYEEILGKEGWNYIPVVPRAYSGFYKQLNKYSYFVHYDNSTMGYEALACNKRVACFNISNVNPNWYKSRRFFTCENFPKGSKKNDGPFFTHNYDKRKFDRIMHFIMTATEVKWRQVVKKYTSDVIIYDYNNLKFKKFIKSLLVQV